jgi:hypothetical protein
MHQWADRAGLDRGLMIYSDPVSLQSGGAAHYSSGQIALDAQGWSAIRDDLYREVVPAGDIAAQVRFAHEVGHELLGHGRRFGGRDIEPPNWAERAASRVGAEIFPEIRHLMFEDIRRRGIGRR